MKKTLLSLTLLASANALASAPLTVEHLNRFNKLHDVVLSDDGRFLVYGQTNAGFSPADSSSDLYLMDLSNLNKVTRLTQSAGRESQLQWANDGQSLYFVANRSGSNQVWQLPLYGGEALQVRLARKLAMTPEWDRQTVRNAAEQRKLMISGTLPWPSTATRTRASRIAGKDNCRSTMRMISVSTRPPA